jgi:hypothetical protein
MTGDRCVCGYPISDVAEQGKCRNCGKAACVQCAYIEPKACEWFCSDCAGERFSVVSEPRTDYGRSYSRPGRR